MWALALMLKNREFENKQNDHDHKLDKDIAAYNRYTLQGKLPINNNKNKINQ